MKQPLCVNRMCTLVPFYIVWYTKTECGIQTKENKMEKKNTSRCDRSRFDGVDHCGRSRCQII